MPPKRKRVVESDSEEEKPKRGAKKAAPKKASPKKSGTKDAKSPEKKKEEEPTFNWWDMDESEFIHEGNVKWKTIVHAGPMFAPPYVPHNIPVKYEGREFIMTPDEEEIATFFACMRQSHYYQKPVYRENFFKCWTEVLHKRPEGRKIKELALCNFDAIYEHYERQREIKKAMTKTEKQAIKDAEEEKVEKYRWVIWDGRKERLANPRVEPPGLFQGRGLHPRMGMLKKRIQPEDVTINTHDLKNPPPPPEGHKWGAVVSDNTVTWLARWHDTNTGDVKYTMVDPKSGALKQYTDRLKFEKARKLKTLIDKVRSDYTEGFKSKDPHRVQMSVAMYFIDRLALRVGGEKGEDEADTVGCCSLRFEHVTPFSKEEDGETRYYLHFDFLGKDSIRYVNDMPITKDVHEQVKRLLVGKDSRPLPQNQLFDLVQPAHLNQHFKNFMEGLTAKVFRTYNASYLLDQIFHNEPVEPKMTEAEKMVYFTNANTKVAILCNHQKTAAKGHEAAKENLSAGVQHLRDLQQSLEEAHDKLSKCKKGEFDKLWAKTRDAFNEVQDAKQYEWLEKYGKEEDKEKYDEIVAKRDGKKATPKASGKKRKAEEMDSDSEEIGRRPKKAKASPKPGGKKRKLTKEESSEEDESDEPPKKKGKKAVPKKGKKVVDESEDEDESEDASSEEAPKPKGKKAAPKRGKKKVESESEDDDDDDDESEEESSDDAKPAKKGAKKPASKKAAPKKAAKKATPKKGGKKK